MKNIKPQLIASFCMAIFGFLGIEWWGRSYANFFLGGFSSFLLYAAVFLLISSKRFFREIASLKKNL